jgi:hypothetical protein
MNQTTITNPNPLARWAGSLPNGIGATVALLARIAGIALAIAVALSQSYDPTRVFATTIAALVALSCIPFPIRNRGWLTWLGAGLAFFGGALLAHIPAGALMLLCGALAAVGAAVDEQQRSRRSAVLFFFVGFGVSMAVAVAIILSFEG